MASAPPVGVPQLRELLVAVKQASFFVSAVFSIPIYSNLFRISDFEFRISGLPGATAA
jgi:hypothetical protein